MLIEWVSTKWTGPLIDASLVSRWWCKQRINKISCRPGNLQLCRLILISDHFSWMTPTNILISSLVTRYLSLLLIPAMLLHIKGNWKDVVGVNSRQLSSLFTTSLFIGQLCLSTTLHICSRISQKLPQVSVNFFYSKICMKTVWWRLNWWTLNALWGEAKYA